MVTDTRKIVVGISGASGVIYAIRLLEVLRETEGIETHLVISPNGEKNISIETEFSIDQVVALADFSHDYTDLAAPISSGSFLTEAMVVVPCSMKSLSEIATSHGANLLARSADVTLKEGRPLVLVPRETPLHKGHLQLLLQSADLGALIVPPMPAFYTMPKSIDDIINQSVGKILDRLKIDNNLYPRWARTPGGESARTDIPAGPAGIK